MALPYVAPDIILQRELEEVARDAKFLLEYVSQANSLSENFPAHQLRAIAISLSDIGGGTAQGCKAALEYARSRLPAIRREYVLSNDPHVVDAQNERPPPTLRGEELDRKLRDLIASVTTALDEYRRQATETEKVDELPAPSVQNPQTESISNTRSQAHLVERNLSEMHGEIRQNTRGQSPRADALGRQIKDAESLTRLAEAELGSSRIVLRWYRGVVTALRNYPTLIRKTGTGLKTTVDVAESAVDWWHNFKHGLYHAGLEGLRNLGDTFEHIADQLEGADRHDEKPAIVTTVDDDYWPKKRINDYFVEGRKIPAHVMENVFDLSFGNVSIRLKTIDGISQFKNLTQLRLTRTGVPSLAPLKGLNDLESLDLRHSRLGSLDSLPILPSLRSLDVDYSENLKDISAVRRQRKLQRLDLRKTAVSDISPCSNLKHLSELYLGNTKVKNIAPLASLKKLAILDLSSCEVTSFGVLRKLGELTELDLSKTSFNDLALLESLTKLQELDISNTPIRTLASIAHLELRELNIAGTEIEDVWPLASMKTLQRLTYSGKVENLNKIRFVRYKVRWDR